MTSKDDSHVDHNSNVDVASTIAANNKRHQDEITALKQQHTEALMAASSAPNTGVVPTDLKQLEDKEKAIVDALKKSLVDFNAALASAFAAGIVAHVGVGPTMNPAGEEILTEVKLMTLAKTTKYPF
jgi:hypothetical protein